MTNPRTPKLFTLPTDLIAALAVRAKETGEPMSRIVEQGLRHVLSLPAAAPEADEDDDRAAVLAPTRSERAVAQVLAAAGPGWHSTHDLMKPAGLSKGVTEKALCALALRGEVFRWGEAVECYDGQMISGWGTRPALEVVGKLCDATARKLATMQPCQASDDAIMQLVALVRKLAHSIDEIDQVRALVSAAVGLPPEALEISNLRERVDTANARERARAGAVN